MMYWYDDEVDDEPLLMDTWWGAGIVASVGYLVLGCTAFCGGIKRLFNRCSKLVRRGR